MSQAARFGPGGLWTDTPIGHFGILIEGAEFVSVKDGGAGIRRKQRIACALALSFRHS